MVVRHTDHLAVTIFIFSTIINSCYGQIVVADVKEDQGTGSTVYRFTRPPSGEEYSLFRSSDTSYSLFAVSSLGVVTTRKPLVFTVGKPNRYDLTVVRRPRGETQGGTARTLRVTVKDRDNFPPAFGAAVYYGRVAEGSPGDTVVDGLEKCYAEDRDTTGIDSYKIVSGNDRRYFKIETKKVGTRQFVVLKTTNVPIVRDPNSPSITLTVQAQQTGTTKIEINIEDANDHAPIFERNKYSATVSEDTAVQTAVLKVVAKDEDVGTNGGVYYYLNPLSNYFMVDAITGVIKVAQPLDYRTHTHTLKVFATDRRSPSKSSSVDVQIKISEDIRSYPPSKDTPNPGQNTSPFFLESSYITSIREDFPVKGALLLIRAADNDPYGPNKRLTYTLSGVGSTDFLINSKSGLVTLAQKVNYKTGASNKYSLTVEARDESGKDAKGPLTIDIQDVDENRYAPQFSPQQLQTEISEDASLKTSVIKVSTYASDKDGSGSPDGKISYSIIQGSGMGFFEVDPNTGTVSTSALLDREKRTHYNLVIKAEDRATFPKSSNLYLMITVKDTDDNNPYFTQPMYIAKVPEKRPENTFVTVVRAIDLDENPSISYSILTSQSAFKMETTTGVVRTGRSLDPTREKEFELIIEATSNNNKKAKGQLNVTVTSKADNPPEFKNAPYAVTVPENQGKVSDLLCISAVDAHELIVKYSIVNGGSEFAIDTYSGRFSAEKSFNYEVDDRYKIQVEAVSGNSNKKVSTDIDITVSDEKDSPSFSQDRYDLVIAEDRSSGSTIDTGMRIIDEDTLPDQFECTMENIELLSTIEYLSVKQSGGECKIVTKKALDTFITPTFKFEIRATDKNFRNMFATAVVVIKVGDKNNHDPIFSQSSYWVSVSSDTPNRTRILQLKTHDKDQGKFGEVTFQFIQLGSSNTSRFSIDDNSGLISSSTKLIKNTRYQLQAKAIDGGQNNAKSATVSVYISVYDTVDTPVKFEQDSYSGSVKENAAKNFEILQVKATKSGSTTGISYQLVGAYEQGSSPTFSIGSSSGKVTLISGLDREQRSSYNLIIRAKHVGGIVELATNVRCVITVEDINDVAPKFMFDKDPKTFSVDNHSPSDIVFGKVDAVDLDEGTNGKVSYSIDSSSAGAPFKIDADNGNLMTKDKLSVTFTGGADSKTFPVTIVATDGGSTSQKTQKTINVDVINVHEPPIFDQSKYEVSVPEDKRVGESVTSLKAKYADSKAFLKYSFQSGNTDNAFCINKDGKITVARPLDREKVSVYTLKVQVARGKDKAYTKVVVKVTDMNDNSPQFEKELYQFPVPENAGPGTTVGRVVANDRDEDDFGKVSYEVLQGVDIDSESLFNVNKDSGIITTKKALDYEDIKQHILFVKAEDKGVTKRSAVTEVRINVTRCQR